MSNSSVVIINGKVITGSGDVVVAKGPSKTEERKLPSFSDIRIEAPVEMTYAVSATPSLRITAPENILPLVTTAVEGDALVIGTKNAISLDKPIRIAATGPSPEALGIFGAANVKASGLKSKSLRLRISGAGTISAAGSVDAVDVGVTGSGNVDVEAVHAEDVIAEVSGAGNILAFASHSVRAGISGAGNLTIAGNPTQRSVERSGAGRVVFK